MLWVLRTRSVVDGYFWSVSCGLLSMCIVCSGKSASMSELLCWVSTFGVRAFAAIQGCVQWLKILANVGMYSQSASDLALKIVPLIQDID